MGTDHVFHNMAVCHHLLGQPELAEPLARRVVQADPGNVAARELLKGLEADLAKMSR